MRIPSSMLEVVTSITLFTRLLHWFYLLCTYIVTLQTYVNVSYSPWVNAYLKLSYIVNSNLYKPFHQTGGIVLNQKRFGFTAEFNGRSRLHAVTFLPFKNVYYLSSIVANQSKNQILVLVLIKLSLLFTLLIYHCTTSRI